MGDYVRLAGRRFTVTGLLRATGSQDDRLLIVDLPAAQEILGKPGAVTLVEIRARDADRPTDEVVAQLGDALPQAEVRAVQEAVEGSLHTVSRFRTFGFAIVGVVIAIEALVIFLTMMGSVERTHARDRRLSCPRVHEQPRHAPDPDRGGRGESRRRRHRLPRRHGSRKAGPAGGLRVRATRVAAAHPHRRRRSGPGDRRARLPLPGVARQPDGPDRSVAGAVRATRLLPKAVWASTNDGRH